MIQPEIEPGKKVEAQPAEIGNLKRRNDSLRDQIFDIFGI